MGVIKEGVLTEAAGSIIRKFTVILYLASIPGRSQLKDRAWIRGSKTHQRNRMIVRAQKSGRGCCLCMLAGYKRS